MSKSIRTLGGKGGRGLPVELRERVDAVPDARGSEAPEGRSVEQNEPLCEIRALRHQVCRNEPAEGVSAQDRRATDNLLQEVLSLLCPHVRAEPEALELLCGRPWTKSVLKASLG